MPKVSNTRLQRAEQLLSRLQRGPALIMFESADMELREQIRNNYKIWVNSWVLPEIEDLIPELRKKIGGT